MIDDLDLAFDERAEKGRHRRGYRRKKSKRRGRGRTFAALFLTFALLGSLAGAGWYGFDRIQGYLVTPDYDGTGTGEVIVEVLDGQTLAEIGNTLVTADVIKSVKAFVEAAEKDPRSQGIQPGKYKVRKQMSGAAALAMLLDLKNKWVNRVTIPEGLSYQQTFEALSKGTKIPVKEFEAAAKDPVALGVPEWWFKRSDGKKLKKSIEGFLYPETYDFPPDATAEQILRTMVEHFNNVMTDLNFAEQVEKERKISPYEALIAASIAQAEAMLDKDMGPVVRVLYNRAYSGEFPCNCLGLDSTVNYWLRITGKESRASEHLTVADLHNPKNPYNTHDFAGMPIGPIGNPGLAALKAAMDPPSNDYYYFVSIDLEGTMAYAKDYNGHLANIQKACKNGIPLC